MTSRKILCLLAAVCLALLLWGCEKQAVPAGTTQPTQPAETTVPKYTVTFRVEGKVYMETSAEAGDCVTVAEPAIAGMKFYGWLDEKEQPVDPGSVEVRKSVTYYASFYPDMTSHEPYLFADKNHFLHPEALLTNEELAVAINMLAAPGAEGYLPKLPDGSEAVNVGDLKTLLEALFPKAMVEQAMISLEGDTITRSTFAYVMEQLLDRAGDAVEIADNSVLPYDVAPGSENAEILLEASFHHTHSDSGANWTQIAEEMKHAAGFFNIDGWLYCIDENGALVRDAQVGVLTFGSDARYTCGDSELDTMVAEILAQIILDNPGAERIDLLRRAFEYSRDSFTYLRRQAYYFGQTGWEIEDAKKMLATKRGNCYSYAAVFWALGRGLGYETIGISGTMTGTFQPHSWVEIFFDGVPYIFDPEMEMVYRFERDIFDKDMFMVDYVSGEYWTYRRP